MKKILLSLCAACAVTVASAAPTQVWTVDQKTAESQTFNTPMAFDNNGNVVAAMPVNGQTVDQGVNIIVMSKTDGATTLTCPIIGAVTVSSITVDSDNNIFVAGSLADEVTFEGKNNTSVTLEGMKIDGDPTIEQNASFIIKYNAQGEVKSSVVFSPEIRPEYAGALDPAAPGAVYFSINHIKASEGNLYASAVYTGITKPSEGVFTDNVTFDGGFNSIWSGMFINDLKACTVFALDNDLKNGSVIANTKIAQNLETEDDEYQALSVAFDVVGSDVYAAFVGYGELKITTSDQALDFAPTSDNRDVIYNYGVYNKTGLVKNLGYKAYTNANKAKSNLISNVIVDKDGNVYGIGSIHTVATDPQNADNEVLGAELIVNVIKPESEINSINKEFINGNTTSEEVASAALLPSGEILINALDFYNMSAESNKGSFADKTSAYTFDGTQIVATDAFTNLIYAVTTANEIATSSVIEGGAAFSLYTDKNSAGIEDIVADENAPVEYYNLQGVRVGNPAAGSVVIRRQGAKATKVLVK